MQVCVLNLLQEASQLQSSGTVTLKPTSSIKTKLQQKAIASTIASVTAPLRLFPAILRCI
jgi:hypothetical protein